MKGWLKKIVKFWPLVARKVAGVLTGAADAANKDGDGVNDSMQ